MVVLAVPHGGYLMWLSHVVTEYEYDSCSNLLFSSWYSKIRLLDILHGQVAAAATTVKGTLSSPTLAGYAAKPYYNIL